MPVIHLLPYSKDHTNTCWHCNPDVSASHITEHGIFVFFVASTGFASVMTVVAPSFTVDSHLPTDKAADVGTAPERHIAVSALRKILSGSGVCFSCFLSMLFTRPPQKQARCNCRKMPLIGTRVTPLRFFTQVRSIPAIETKIWCS